MRRFWMMAGPMMIALVTGCASNTGDAPSDSLDSELQSSRTTYHGKIQVDSSGANDPGSALHDPFTWELERGSRATVCAPAKMDAAHPIHSWDVEVTEPDITLTLDLRAVKLERNGAPVIPQVPTPENHLPTPDSTIKVFEKRGSSYAFFAASNADFDDGDYPYVERNIADKKTYRVVAQLKDTTKDATMSLCVNGRDAHPSPP